MPAMATTAWAWPSAITIMMAILTCTSPATEKTFSITTMVTERSLMSRRKPASAAAVGRFRLAFLITTMTASLICSSPATWNGTSQHSKDCGGNFHTYCPPGEFPRTTNILYHNRGDGTFEDVSQRSGIAAKKGHGLGVAFADYDGDGFTDIFVANDGMQQYLFHNNGNGTFYGSWS